jgi:hypothetical protein
MIRERRIKSGPLLEVEFYPVFADGRKIPARDKKRKPSSEEQKKYNQKQATKKLIRLVNCNFDEDDYLLHPTYRQDTAPETLDQARRDVVNYLRRVKDRRKKELVRLEGELVTLKTAQAKTGGSDFLSDRIARIAKEVKILRRPLKYVYSIEKAFYKTGKRKGRPNYHFHMFVTGGLDRRLMEEMWTNGLRCNADRYQPEVFGPEAAAKYIVKDPQGAKRFACSRNLTKPKEPKPRDGKITKPELERIAKLRVDDAAWWEKRHKGHRFVACHPRWNPYNGQWYMTAILYKTDKDPPPWTTVWDTDDIFDDE